MLSKQWTCSAARCTHILILLSGEVHSHINIVIQALDMQRGEVEHGIPSEMQCPISSDIMRDPVICADGHT